MENFKMLREHIPPLIQNLIVPRFQQHSRCNVLSVGAGTGEMDIEILKIIKHELQKNEVDRQLKIFNRAIEPNEYTCGLYKAAIENLPSPLDQQTEFELCQQSFQEYKESEKSKDESVKFDLVHFIHSIDYVGIEQAVVHCLEKEIGDHGAFACIVEGEDLLTWVISKQKEWHGEDAKDNITDFEIAEGISKIAGKHGWKYEIHNKEYSIDVTEVFDEKSAEGNLLLDFLTHTVNFRKTADEQLVEETLSLIEGLSTVKDGKRFGEKKDSLLLISK